MHYPTLDSAFKQIAYKGSHLLFGLSLLTATGVAMSAAPSTGAQASSSVTASVESASGQAVLDDAVAVRDALAGQPADKTAKPESLRDRVRNFAELHLGKKEHAEASVAFDRDRTFAFAIPATHGILYRSSTHLLTVNALLAGEDHPDAIQLHKTITGPSGQGLVIAPEAKAKGYVQTIDLIELAADGSKTSARGRLKLSPDVFAKADDNFAIVLVCTLNPPYLTDQHEHDDPTDEEPTDITLRTSRLHASVQAVWLINQKDGTILAKGLHLSK